MKLTTRCGEDALAGLNEALLAKAASAKLLRTNKVRADTTVVEGRLAWISRETPANLSVDKRKCLSCKA